MFSPRHVSDNGMVNGNTYGEDYQPLPAYWTESTGIRTYSIPQGSTGYVGGGSENGAFAVGAVKQAGDYDHAAIYRRNGDAILLDNNGYEESQALGISDDGKYVCGFVKKPPGLHDGVFDPGYIALSVWIDGVQHTIDWYDGQQVQDTYSETFSMSTTNDGYITGGTARGSFIWHPSFDGVHSQYQGAQDINTWYQDVTGETIEGVLDGSDIARTNDGTLYVLVSNGVNHEVLSIPSAGHILTGSQQSVTLNAYGTFSNDFFYIDASHYTQITLNSGAGSDFVELVNHPGAGFKANIKTGAGDDGVYLADVSNVTLDTGDGADYLAVDHIVNCNLQTGNGNDQLVGAGFLSIYDATSSHIDTGNGDDFIVVYGGSGNIIQAGNGNDYVSVANADLNGTNRFYLGNGNDQMEIAATDQQVWGGNGNDHIVTKGKRNIIRTEGGNDFVSGEPTPNGEPSMDYIDLGDGNDRYQTYSSSDTVLGGNGNDTFLLNGGAVKAFGEAGNDAFFVFGGNHVISGGTGFDFYSSHGGSSIIDLGTGQPNVLAPQPDDQIVRNTNDYFIRRNMPFIPISRQEYLDVLAPILLELQNQLIRRPQF